MSPLSRHLWAAFLLRLAFIAYGEYQDRVLHVPYTDVDYHVLSGGAEHVARGESPYQRDTYRYTPLLAWALLPNAIWAPFGKVVFSALDVVAGVLIYHLVGLEGGGQRAAVLCAALWWYNPLPITVSSRGSAESPVICLVLYTLYLARRRLLVLAGLVLGAAVHVKLYPAALAPTLYWSLGSAETGWLRRWWWPNAARRKLTLSAAAMFAALTAGSYLCYGEQYAEEAFLYHLTRRDVRHNFSVFYYLLYLTEELQHRALGLIAFLPQMLVVLALGVRFAQPRDIVFAAFSQTYAFVTFNKVCTSQYFLWYLSLLPATLPHISASWKEGALLLVLWYFAQASWLLPAYLLEFEGRAVHRLVWAEGVAFFCANVGILARLVRKYRAEEAETSNLAGLVDAGETLKLSDPAGRVHREARGQEDAGESCSDDTSGSLRYRQRTVRVGDGQ